MRTSELEFLTQGLSPEMRERVIAAWYRLAETPEETFPATLAVTLLSAARAQAFCAQSSLNGFEKAIEAIQANQRLCIKEFEQANQEQMEKIRQITYRFQEVRRETEEIVRETSQNVQSLPSLTEEIIKEAKKLEKIINKDMLFIFGIVLGVGIFAGALLDHFLLK